MIFFLIEIEKCILISQAKFGIERMIIQDISRDWNLVDCM